MELDHVPFVDLPKIEIDAYDMYQGTSPPQVPGVFFEQALRLHPHGGPDQMYAYLGGSFTVSDIVNAKTTGDLYPNACHGAGFDSAPVCTTVLAPPIRDALALQRLRFNDDGSGTILAGMANGVGNGVSAPLGGVAAGRPAMVAEASRPLTSVAHELGHTLGRVHASLSCGGASNGQFGEPASGRNGSDI